MIVNTERKLPDEAALGSSIQPAQHFQMCKSGIFGEGGCKSSALTIKDHLRFLSPYDRQDIFYCHIFWGGWWRRVEAHFSELLYMRI